jgi:hypothetical protein
MSASTRTAPAQIGFGRFPAALAAMALVVILAVALALAAVNGSKSTPAAAAVKGAPPPAFIDHGSRDELNLGAGATGTQSYGGWNGPRSAPVYKGDNSKDDQYIIRHSGSNGPRLRAQ